MLALAVIVAPAAQADDNEIAQHIFQKLKAEQEQGNLKGYRVDMRVDKGTVWFKGFVANAEQEMLILRTAQQAGRLGVIQIVDDIEVRAPEMAQMDMQAPIKPMVESMGREPAMPVSYTNRPESSGMAAGAMAYEPPMMPPQVEPTPVSQTPVQMASTGGPMPVGYTGNMGYTMDNPQLPGYAWPAYAAHPNYAAVSYPCQYSATAWPYIGPFYPYPQVPLGWRKVSLEWDDGWWYLDFYDRGCSLRH
jgi:hypothetical protein